MAEKVQPGIHPDVTSGLNRFTYQETEIIKRLSKEWYITNSGSDLPLGNSVYRYILMKPIDTYQEMFNLEREIIAVFSPYDKFEPRAIEASSTACSKTPLQIKSGAYL
jgi:hypothetical protein